MSEARTYQRENCVNKRDCLFIIAWKALIFKCSLSTNRKLDYHEGQQYIALSPLAFLKIFDIKSNKTV